MGLVEEGAQDLVALRLERLHGFQHSLIFGHDMTRAPRQEWGERLDAGQILRSQIAQVGGSEQPG